MKNMIRAAVVVLALTGASAASHFAAPSQSNGSRMTLTKTSAFPVPTCPPDDPNACGMGGGMGK